MSPPGPLQQQQGRLLRLGSGNATTDQVQLGSTSLLNVFEEAKISKFFRVCPQHNVHPVRQAAGDPAHLRGDHAGGAVAAQAGLPVVHGRPFPRLPLRGAACTVSLEPNRNHTLIHTITHTVLYDENNSVKQL